MITPDTSVTVAAFATWHERHDAALEIVAERPALVAHVLIETYAVLTRLPLPHRAPPELVLEYLTNFPDRVLSLPGSSYRSLMSRVGGAGLAGGSVYDALIAVTAARADATLATLDQRAAPTYRALGADVRLLI